MIIKAKRWDKREAPRRILVLRFHALGDIMITLPYLASLKKNLPGTSFTLLTREEFAEVPQSLQMFANVISFDDRRSGKIQLLKALLKLPSLWLMRFDVVIDLQNNLTSRAIRRFLMPKAWTEFDKSSRVSAADRTQSCIAALALADVKIEANLAQQNRERFQSLIESNKLETGKFVILNPCGAFSSRNWPLERYAEFGQLWAARFPNDRFLILGLPSMKKRVSFLREKLGEKLVDLCGMTNQAQAFGLIRMAKLMLTEDGGLMHMAWVQGVPTLALFGSSPSYWSAPQGAWSLCLNSADLECGDCLLAVCKFQDNRCLTRYSAEMIFEKSLHLLSTLQR